MNSGANGGQIRDDVSQYTTHSKLGSTARSVFGRTRNERGGSLAINPDVKNALNQTTNSFMGARNSCDAASSGGRSPRSNKPLLHKAKAPQSYTMTPREFVKLNLGKSDNKSMGIPGYTLEKRHHPIQPLTAKIFPGKRKTFIDFETKQKAFVPPAKYNVIPDWKDKNTRSGLSKGPRLTIPGEIIK